MRKVKLFTVSAALLVVAMLPAAAEAGSRWT